MLDHLTDAFLITAVPVATAPERRRNTNPRMLNSADPGLIEALVASGRANTGHALETAVFNELARYPSGRTELIQVCADASDTATWERETRALDEASAEHPRAERTIVLLDVVTARSKAHRGTHVVSAHQWLLAGR